MRLRRWQVGWLILAAVGIPLLLAWLTGSLSIPHSDSWAYSRIAEVFAETGRLRLVGWEAISFVGQAMVLGPLGRAIWSQQLFVAILAALSLLITYRLLLPLTSHRRALLGTATVAFFPGFGLLATSYMTDIPAYFTSMLCVLLGELARRRRSPALLTLALLIGLWGTTIREQVVAAPVAVLLALAISWRGRRLVLSLIAAGLAFLVLLVGFEVWRRGLPSGDPLTTYRPTPLAGVKSAFQDYFTLALLISPATFLTARPRAWGRSVRLLALGVGLVGAAAALARKSGLFLGNYLSQTGSYSGVALGERTVFPSLLWPILLAVACVSGALLVGILATQWRRPGLVLGSFTALTALGTVAEGFLAQDMYDRYLLALMPGVLAMALAGPARQVAASVVSLTGLAVLSLLLTANGLAFDAARWHVAQKLVAAGNAPESIDAGFEWVGYHSPAGVVRSGSRFFPEFPGGWWMQYFPDASTCTIVTASPLPGYRTASAHPYRTYALFGRSQLLVQVDPSCSTSSG